MPSRESPYLVRGAEAATLGDGYLLAVKEASFPGFGIALRFQERRPGGPPSDWCITGHSIFVLDGRLRYEFDDHAVEAGPGDMLHIPAGEAHRHKPSVVGEGPVRYVLTEFGEHPRT
ncbi:cupin domain-containing protein [Elioraea sp.]|uniref:cupin domain-containing protein n=1 Tax=Elioraea sp. TaxID=2185103 RepID=UPI0025C69EB4|nr:cupin domain-containing protein [Elioraea sp.]